MDSQAIELNAVELQAVFKDVIRTTGEGIIGIDERNIIYLANDHLHHIWGYEPGELVGQPVQILQPRRYRRDHTTAVREFVHVNKADTSGHWNEVEALHKQGHEFQIFIRIARVQYAGRFLLVAAVRDATAYWQVHAAAASALAAARIGGDPALVASLETLYQCILLLNPATEIDMMRADTGPYGDAAEEEG